MTEHDLVDACQRVIVDSLPGVHLWKVNDNRTGGVPDLFVAWRGHVTMIEFKYMKKGETIHDKWEDERQPVTCAKLENSMGRCWAVAYQDAWKLGGRQIPATLVYRPTKLLRGALPEPEGWVHHNDAFLMKLWKEGVVKFPNHNHAAVAALIRGTHL